MKEVAAILSAVSEEDSENILTLENVKNWLFNYIQMHDEEVARFPEERNRVHWDLLAADFDPNRQAMFLLALFRDATVVFLSGRGSIPDVRDFAQNTYPKEPEEVLDEVSRRFWIGGRTTVAYNDVIKWSNL